MKHTPDKNERYIWKGRQNCTTCGAFRVTTQTRQNAMTKWSPWAKAGSTIGYNSNMREVVLAMNRQPRCQDKGA